MAKVEPIHDYSQYKDEAPKAGGNILARLGGLARDQLHADARVTHLTEELKQAKEILRHISENQLPTLMEEAGQAEDITVDGLHIEMRSVIRGSIPKATENVAFAWLEKHGHERLIKRQFTIDFGKEQDAWANKFERDCARRKKPLTMKRKKTVAPPTLQAFVRTQLEEGIPIPMDIFGVHRQRFAKVKVR